MPHKKKRELVLSAADVAELKFGAGIFNDDTRERAILDIAHKYGVAPTQIDRTIDWRSNMAVNALYRAAYSRPQLRVLTSKANTLYVAGGVRGGKSHSSADRQFNFTIRDLACNYLDEGAVYWLVGNKYLNVEAEFKYLKLWFGNLGMVKSATDRFDPGEIVLNVCPLATCSQRLNTTTRCRHDLVRFLTKSAQDEKSLASVAPYGILGCEGSQLSSWAHTALLERALENDAPLTISGTLDAGQSGWFWEAFDRYEKAPEEHPDFEAISIPTYSNKAIFPEGIKDKRIQNLKALMTPNTWKSRIEGRPAPLPDLVFGNVFNPKYHISSTELQIDTNRELWITIDHGYQSAYAVLFIQFDRMGPDIEVIQVKDEIFVNHTFGEDVARMALGKDWFKIMYEKDLIKGTGDPASEHHHAQPSQIDSWKKVTNIVLSPPERSSPIDQIDRVRAMMGVHPKYNRSYLEIDPKCRGLLSEMGYCRNPLTGEPGAYKYATDDKEQVIKESLIDANNHAVKALAYFIKKRMSSVYSPDFYTNASDIQRQINERNRTRRGYY